ncbi:MAG: cytidine deaminase [Clostridia bacterium]|nr:cytidine deaminase [Clostridia bacterium]
MTDKELCRLAVEAREKAYAPYSGYRVGAALLAKSGEVYLGSNIENAAYTPTVCAERTAFFKAVSEGETEFFAIAVAGGNGDKVGGAFPPCGVCRQVMAEFCDGDFKILTVTGDGMFEEYTLTELLPLAFSPKNLERK